MGELGVLDSAHARWRQSRLGLFFSVAMKFDTRRKPVMKHSRRKIHLATAALAAWLVAAAGCGSSVYGEKFQHRLDELRISGEFSALRPTTDDLAINFRVPLVFTKAFNRISADPENNNMRILPLRFAPPFLADFPGLQLMFEGEYASKDMKTPLYLYIGEGDPSSVKGKFPYELWRDRIKRGQMNPGKKFEPVDALTPKGEKLHWMRLIATGKHVYDIARNNNVEYKSVDTFFQMWVYEAPQAIAILGWWSTEDARVPSDIEKLAMLTAGTAVVSPTAAAAAAKPK